METTTRESVLAAHGDYFTVREAARLLKMTEAHLRTEIRWGRIPAVRRGRLLLIRPEAVASQFSDAAEPELVVIADALRRPGTACTQARPATKSSGGKHTVRAARAG